MDSSVLAGLLDETSSTNATRATEVCSQVVEQVIYRGANRDFAGIGVLTTLAIQVIVVFGFINLPSLICACITQTAGTKAKTFAYRLRSLCLPTFKTSFLLCLIVMISSLVRVYQSPPLFELALLRDVTEYEAALMLATALGYIIHRCLGLPLHDEKDKMILTDLKVWLCCTIQFLVRTVVTAKIQKGLSSGQIVQKIAYSCAKLEQFADLKAPAIRTPSLRTPLGGGWGIFAAAIGFLLLVAGPLALILIGQWPFDKGFLKARPTRVFAGTILVIIFGMSTALDLYNLIDTRSNLLTKCGGARLEQWGFFQVAAILVWLPLAMRISLVVLSLIPVGATWGRTFDVILVVLYGDSKYSVRDPLRATKRSANENVDIEKFPAMDNDEDAPLLKT